MLDLCNNGQLSEMKPGRFIYSFSFGDRINVLFQQ